MFPLKVREHIMLFTISPLLNSILVKFVEPEGALESNLAIAVQAKVNIFLAEFSTAFVGRDYRHLGRTLHRLYQKATT